MGPTLFFLDADRGRCFLAQSRLRELLQCRRGLMSSAEDRSTAAELLATVQANIDGGYDVSSPGRKYKARRPMSCLKCIGERKFADEAATRAALDSPRKGRKVSFCVQRKDDSESMVSFLQSGWIDLTKNLSENLSLACCATRKPTRVAQIRYDDVDAAQNS